MLKVIGVISFLYYVISIDINDIQINDEDFSEGLSGELSTEASRAPSSPAVFGLSKEKRRHMPPSLLTLCSGGAGRVSFMIME
ncbi:hypothetical protein ABK905_24900 [Acerihabitans sp. KWT182]|uniref:Uncharacterized protein n=1 Tax=Acerihabitans sp. KWT182 TaxID=3157919 RepID=A0AAU7Q8N5_9GAMM